MQKTSLVRFREQIALPTESTSQVEKVQRTATHWTCRRWRNTSSVGEKLGYSSKKKESSNVVLEIDGETCFDPKKGGKLL